MTSSGGKGVTTNLIQLWIENTEPTKWMGTKLPIGKKSRFGYSCSSIVESFNSHISKERELPLTNTIGLIIEKESLKGSFVRDTNSPSLFFCKKDIQEEYLQTPNVQLTPIEYKGMRIINGGNGMKPILASLDRMYCSCGIPEDQKRYCIHLASLCRSSSKSPFDSLPSYYFYESYRKFHSIPLLTPSLYTIKKDRYETTAFTKRNQLEHRIPSTFNDSSCLKKWKSTNTDKTIEPSN